MNQETPRIKLKNRGRCIYRDTSSRGKGRGRHDCWRAEINEITPGGVKRMRKRFKYYLDAWRWLYGYGYRKDYPDCST